MATTSRQSVHHTVSEKTHETGSDSHGSDSGDDIRAAVPALRGRRLIMALTFVSGTNFILFGYDQGVMSALLTANQFEKVFPQVVDDGPSNHATLQSFIVAVYEIGCLFGALSNLWLGDKLGRRKTIYLGSVIVIIGAILQATSFTFTQMVVARIVSGLGIGLNTSTVPSYQAECSPAASRGTYMVMQCGVSTLGLMTSVLMSNLRTNKWIDFGFYWLTGSSAQWRVPIALQNVLASMMIVGIAFLPESPRWLAKHGRDADALAVISALEDKVYTSEPVQLTYHGIREAIAVESHVGPSNKSPLQEVFTNGPSQNFRRTSIAVLCQCFQQISGQNMITYFATIVFQRLGFNDVKSRIMAAANGTEFFLASFIAVGLIDRVGRRPLMLFATTGQSITMVVLAVLGSINTSRCQIASAVLMFVFNTFFAIGWLGMTWLYCAEIVGLRIRAPANAFSTASVWTFNFVVVMITSPSFHNIGWRTYIVFASLNAAIVPVIYVFFPETVGRSLEDMDVVFALAYTEGVSPVAVSLRKDVPLAGTPEADAILGVRPEERIQNVEDVPFKE
ncbi:general substrate transporter [Laetiporus sulphureus 93-53]|uniref:General substrate transporter n=1 Tax=Laetiporus sulphureus 93-53 TaxID=1314785 RepID=A0A165CV31_9APHY|nr:general substrate transporter [Laetiporus sulphureus 93-53]KZT03480.1 general substrate transporter [Laetiporus sulphureus 93-53]